MKKGDAISVQSALAIPVAAICLIVSAITGYSQEDKQAFYFSRFYASGFMLRAARTCGGDWQRMTMDAIDITASPELQRIANAFPDTAKGWGMDGATNFNRGVMTDGLASACATALKFREKAEETPEVRNAPRNKRVPGRTAHENNGIPPAKVDGSEHAIEIPLKTEGGTFVVPVLINGQITLDFIVDSGAADVSIPADVVSTLMRTGSLKTEDFTGNQVYELADGSKVPSLTFTIKTLKVGEVTLENIKGGVAPNSAKLLLGQSFLSRFTSWSIDNERQLLLLK